MTFHRGKVHEYLKTDVEYSEKGSVKVSMIKYINKVHIGFPEETGSPEYIPVADWMFQVR